MDSSNAATLWTQTDGSVRDHMRVQIATPGGSLLGSAHHNSTVASGGILTPMVMTHIAFVKNGSSYTMWVDGQNQGSVVGGVNGVNLTTPFYIGSQAEVPGRHFIGSMKEFAIHNVAKYTAPFAKPETLNLTPSNPGWANILRGIKFDAGIVDVKGFQITNNGVFAY